MNKGRQIIFYYIESVHTPLLLLWGHDMHDHYLQGKYVALHA